MDGMNSVIRQIPKSNSSQYPVFGPCPLAAALEDLVPADHSIRSFLELLSGMQGPIFSWQPKLKIALAEHPFPDQDWRLLSRILTLHYSPRANYLFFRIAQRLFPEQAVLERLLVLASSAVMDTYSHRQDRLSVLKWASITSRHAGRYRERYPDRYETHKLAAVAAQEIFPFDVPIAILDDANGRRARNPDRGNFLHLSPALFTRIGSTMHAETLIKSQRLEWDAPRRLLCVYDKPDWGNAHLVEKYLSQYISFIPVQEASAEILENLEQNDSWFEFVVVQKGQARFTPAATISARNAWLERRLPPLFTLDNADRQFGEQFLREQGFDIRRKFVTLHCRAESNEKTDFRNSQVQNLSPTLEWLTREGFSVIRIGDASMVPLSKMDHVLDFATDFEPSSRLNVFFMAACAFYVGSASGPLTVPHAFGVSTVCFDTLPLGAACGTALDTYLANPLRDRETGNLVGWERAFTTQASLSHFEHQWESLRLTPLANTSLDILEAIQYHAAKIGLIPRSAVPDLPDPSPKVVDQYRKLAQLPSTPLTEAIQAELSPPFMHRYAHLLASR